MEHLFTPSVSVETASLWEHCRRAMQAAWHTGVNGLPLFGGCDWNDGLNKVGDQGRGESVWLAWFFAGTLEEYAFCGDSRDPRRRRRVVIARRNCSPR